MVGLTCSCIDTLLYSEHTHLWPKNCLYPGGRDSSILLPDRVAEINKFEVAGNIDETLLYFAVVPGRDLDKKGK